MIAATARKNTCCFAMANSPIQCNAPWNGNLCLVQKWCFKHDPDDLNIASIVEIKNDSCDLSCAATHA